MAIGCAVGAVSVSDEPTTGQGAAAAAEIHDRVCAGAIRPSLKEAASILGQNSLVIANLVLGAATLGVRVAAQLLGSGADVSVHYVAAVRRSGSRAFAVSALLPHGMLELPAFAAAGATGIGLTHIAWLLLLRRRRPTRADLTLLAKELPLPFFVLTLAALIEEFVTPYIMNLAMHC